MADIVEAWMWKDPGEIIERLLARSGRCSHAPALEVPPVMVSPNRIPRDRYYTQAKRLHIRGIMKQVHPGRR